MVSLLYAILDGMQCVPDTLPIVRPATQPARVHWLPATADWAAQLKDWIAQGKQREALPWLVGYRREAWAQALLGEIRWKDEASSHKAFRWFRRAAPRSENQDPVVLRLAQCYERGIGTSVNLFMAWHFYVRAAKALNVESLEALGDLESQGLLLPINRVRAGMWYMVCCALIKDEQRKAAIEDRLSDLVCGGGREAIDRLCDDAWQWLCDYTTE